MVEGADNRFESVERGPPSVSVSVSVVGVSVRRRRRSFKRSVGLVGEERERLMKKKKSVDVCVGPCVSPSCCARYASQNAASSSRSVDCQVRKVFAAPLPASRVPPPFHRIRDPKFPNRAPRGHETPILFYGQTVAARRWNPAQHQNSTQHHVPPLGSQPGGKIGRLLP